MRRETLPRRTGAGLVLAGLLAGGVAADAQETPRPDREPGWIGIQYTVVETPPGAPGSAAVPVVTGIVRGSPAHRAGLQVGDTIVDVDGRSDAHRALMTLSRRLRPGEPVRLTLRREGDAREVRVVAARRPARIAAPPLPPRVVVHLDSMREHVFRHMDSLQFHVRVSPGPAGRFEVVDLDSAAIADLEEREGAMRRFSFAFSGDSAFGFHVDSAGAVTVFRRPESAPRPPTPTNARWTPEARRPPAPEAAPQVLMPYMMGRDYVAGARLTALNTALAEYFSVDEGVLVTEVVEGTPAGQAGLLPGDVIVAVGEDPVSSVQELRAVLAGSWGRSALSVIRKGSRIEVRLPR